MMPNTKKILALASLVFFSLQAFAEHLETQTKERAEAIPAAIKTMGGGDCWYRLERGAFSFAKIKEGNAGEYDPNSELFTVYGGYKPIFDAVEKAGLDAKQLVGQKAQVNFLCGYEGGHQFEFLFTVNGNKFCVITQLKKTTFAVSHVMSNADGKPGEFCRSAKPGQMVLNLTKPVQPTKVIEHLKKLGLFDKVDYYEPGQWIELETKKDFHYREQSIVERLSQDPEIRDLITRVRTRARLRADRPDFLQLPDITIPKK